MAANLKEVRSRIKSVISTQQITKAMKMVSAAKLRKAQQAIIQMRPYSNKLNAMMKNIMTYSDGEGAAEYAKISLNKKPLLVIITSDRGLCGAFNSNILKLVHKSISDNYQSHLLTGDLTAICIGKKGFEYMRRRFPKCQIISDHQHLYHDSTFENVVKLADKLMEHFKSGTYDQIEIFYSRFKNAATQFPEREQYLPVPKVEKSQSENNTPKHKPDYLFEPKQDQLLAGLIPSILQAQLYKCILDTQASEHGSRMTAMDKASENAETMLGELKINYNKARQEAITKELSEIVGGVAALAG